MSAEVKPTDWLSYPTENNNEETVMIHRQDTPVEHKILRSIQELADFLGCSTVTAQKFKNEGRIPYRQINRKVMFDTAEVLQAIDLPRNKKVKNRLA